MNDQPETSGTEKPIIADGPSCRCPCHTGKASHVAACQCQRPPSDFSRYLRLAVVS